MEESITDDWSSILLCLFHSNPSLWADRFSAFIYRGTSSLEYRVCMGLRERGREREREEMMTTKRQMDRVKPAKQEEREAERVRDWQKAEGEKNDRQKWRKWKRADRGEKGRNIKTKNEWGNETSGGLRKEGRKTDPVSEVCATPFSQQAPKCIVGVLHHLIDMLYTLTRTNTFSGSFALLSNMIRYKITNHPV